MYDLFFRKFNEKVALTAEEEALPKTYLTPKKLRKKQYLLQEGEVCKYKAFVEKGSGNAKLKVQFFWPFKGKYWIIDLAEDYSYVVVSHPNRKYLWILSRTSNMNENLYQQILSRLKENGFDLTKLQTTKQI